MLRMLNAAADLMLFPNSSHSYIKRMACLCKTGTFIIQVTRNIQSRSMFGNPTVRDLHIYIYFFKVMLYSRLLENDFSEIAVDTFLNQKSYGVFRVYVFCLD